MATSGGGSGRRILGWLGPGFGFKRHVAVLALGAVLGALGLSELLRRSHLHALQALNGGVAASSDLEALALLLAGAVLSVYAIGRITRSVVDAAIAPGVGRLFRVYPEAALASRGPRVVALGGGTGQSVLLRGLKRYTWNITAVVAVSDDGGSSGRLRQELRIPPPGDIRNCLVALADTEPLMERLFQHRMQSGGELEGHAFGNLFLAAMTQVTGDFDQAIRASSRVLAVRGTVLPSTLEPVVLRGELLDGRVVEGESAIARSDVPIRRVFLSPESPEPVTDVLRAIADADMIVMGPGSLYTSVVPNLLVRGMAEALRASKATRVHVANIMTQPGETDHMTAADHTRALIAHGAPVDVVIVNTRALPPEALRRYQSEGSEPVLADVEGMREMGVRAVTGPLWDTSFGVVRHDPDVLARLLLGILWERRPWKTTVRPRERGDAGAGRQAAAR